MLLLMLPTVAAPALTDFDTLWTLLSVMALGDFGWLGMLFFTVAAITVLAFALGLYGSFAPNKKTRTALYLMYVTATCLMLLVFIDIDHVHGIWTLKRVAHWSIATVGIATFITACYLITANLKYNRTWQTMYVFTIVFAVLCLVAGLILAATTRAGFVALLERLVLTVGVIWVEVMSLRVYRLSGGKIILDVGA